MRSELPKMQRSGSSGPSGFSTATSTRTMPWSSVLRDDGASFPRSVYGRSLPLGSLLHRFSFIIFFAFCFSWNIL